MVVALIVWAIECIVRKRESLLLTLNKEPQYNIIMKYEFSKHVGDVDLTWDRFKCFDRMVDVLASTGSQVKFHIRRKGDRHFLCPFGMVCYEDGKVNLYVVSAFTNGKGYEVKPDRFSCQMMIQIIKKALKNKVRESALASVEH